MDASLLADLAWTAAVGRSHFQYRAGIVFNDIDQLRKKLEKLAASSADAEYETPAETQKVAFTYTAQDSQLIDLGLSLYMTEPVARDVLDRCHDIFQREQGVSLLDVITGATEGDSASKNSAVYALECALTDLWKSVGVSPDVVVVSGLGEIAAMYAAGVLTLEEGLKSVTAPDRALSYVDVSSASVPIVSYEDYPQALVELGRGHCVIEVDARSEFADSAARGYEAGCKIDFTGLFAGESRRRVPLPSYAFQRRRHWVDAPQSIVAQSQEN